jgi:hypothetical protein
MRDTEDADKSLVLVDVGVVEFGDEDVVPNNGCMRV